jgi:hypothetical protein
VGADRLRKESANRNNPIELTFFHSSQEGNNKRREKESHKSQISGKEKTKPTYTQIMHPKSLNMAAPINLDCYRSVPQPSGSMPNFYVIKVTSEEMGHSRNILSMRFVEGDQLIRCVTTGSRLTLDELMEESEMSVKLQDNFICDTFHGKRHSSNSIGLVEMIISGTGIVEDVCFTLTLTKGLLSDQICSNLNPV